MYAIKGEGEANPLRKSVSVVDPPIMKSDSLSSNPLITVSPFKDPIM
jgi:hypothetical protein